MNDKRRGLLFGLSLTEVLSVLGFIVSVIAVVSAVRSCATADRANILAKEIESREAARIKAEQVKNAYLAFKLGRDLTELTASLRGITPTWSSDRIPYLQGTVDQLGLRLDLSYLLGSMARAEAGFGIHLSGPLVLIAERIRDFHSQEVEAAFNAARYAIWLAEMGHCEEGPEISEKIRNIYNRDAPFINQWLREMGRLSERKISEEFRVPEEVTDMREATDKLVELLLSADSIFEQNTGQRPATYMFSCPFQFRRLGTGTREGS